MGTWVYNAHMGTPKLEVCDVIYIFFFLFLLPSWYYKWQNKKGYNFLTWEKFKLLREACEDALIEKHLRDASQTEGFLDEASTSKFEQLMNLERVFKKAAEADIPTEVCSCFFFFSPLLFYFSVLNSIVAVDALIGISGARLPMLQNYSWYIPWSCHCS